MVDRVDSALSELKTATADQILAAATQLFARRGFDGTSLQEIADAVGVRKASLLYHYASKDDLRRSVLESLLSRWNDVVPRLLFAASNGEDQFDSLVGETAGFFAADPDRARLLLREVLDRPEELNALVRTHVAPWVDVIANYVRKGVGQGVIHPATDPEAYVVAVINLILSSFATADCFGALVPRQRHIDEVLRLARTSLFSTPRPSDDAGPRSKG